MADTLICQEHTLSGKIEAWIQACQQNFVLLTCRLHAGKAAAGENIPTP